VEAHAREARLTGAAAEAFAAAETMDATFQDFLSTLAARTDESAEEARARAARLNERIEALTTAIVAVEERLVALDEVLARPMQEASAATAEGGDDGIGDLARAAQRLREGLEPLVAMLAPADRYVADVRARGAEASQAIDTALDRIATILTGFTGREDRRRFHRVHADLGAKILVEGTWTDCRIINISLGGAAIDTAIDCAAGQLGQLSLHGWDGLMPVIVTGVSQGRTHLCFQVTEALERSIKSFIDQLPVAA
jgi:hypothetical protein